MGAIDLAAKLATFDEQWKPKIVAGYNGSDVMVVKLGGAFQWHSHPDTDDLFYVLKGTLTLEMRDGDVTLNAGEMYVIPRGVEHRPVADGEAHILLIEQRGTPNTGNHATAAVKVPI